MKASKKLLLAGVSTLPLITLAAGGVVRADEINGRDGFANKLAGRFNLNKNEVRSFIEEHHDARHAEMLTKVSEALKSAGFTDEQISALQTKKDEQRTEHQAWHEANPDASEEERRAHRETKKTEFESWATEQGIDLEKVRGTLKSIMPQGRRHRFMHNQ